MISDLVLSACSFVAGTMRMNRMRAYSWRYATIGWFGMFGFSLIGFAAFLGVLRFGYFFPRRQHSLESWHKYFTALASIIGLPMIAAAYTQRTEYQNLCWMFLVLSIISTLLHCIEALHVAVRDFCAVVSVLFVIISAVFMEYRGQVNRYSLAGSCCFIFATIVSDQGRGFQGIKNVDLFHYFLSVGVCLLSEGLLL